MFYRCVNAKCLHMHMDKEGKWIGESEKKNLIFISPVHGIDLTSVGKISVHRDSVQQIKIPSLSSSWLMLHTMLVVINF